MADILLITPPLLQPNSPYPATAYLKGYLGREGVDAVQMDLSIELLERIFSDEFLAKVFEKYASDHDPRPEYDRMLRLKERYTAVIGTVMSFLRSADAATANLICTLEFIPQGPAFEDITDLDAMFGSGGTADCAKYLCTLLLRDLSDLIRHTVTDHFEMVKYAEKIAVTIPSFKLLEPELSLPLNLIEQEMSAILLERLNRERPKVVAFTVPFPGNLIPALRCASEIKRVALGTITVAGGGYPSTELRSMSDKGIFRYFDFIVLDGGEKALLDIVKGGLPSNTYTKSGFQPVRPGDSVSHRERGCPDFSGLPHEKYFSLLEFPNPMHRLWNDGRWNKLMTAYGCYWSQCAFCDTSLDYICRYDPVPARTIADQMDAVYAQTGSRGFHFVDEAASPALLKELSLELIRRKRNYVWWTNIRFESAFTGDLCRLMSAAGCIAVSGGLEAASDRLLALMDKGVTIETATISMRNFYYAGIMVHTYLMYGFPSQTLQETIDSIEVVRQMFRAELIGSAYWHRYAMTVHSPSGREPEKYGVRRRNDHVNTFANNEVAFAEDRGFNIAAAGSSLREVLASYLAGQYLDRPVHKWFEGKAPATTVEGTEITDHLIKPDRSRIYDDRARIVWIGALPVSTGDGLTVHSPSAVRELKFSTVDAEFIYQVAVICSDLSVKTTLGELKNLYGQKDNSNGFATLYHSKKWDILREYGLLQI